jgi:hypothetical protein
MRKLTVLAMVATLAMAGSAFAVERHLTIAPNATFAAGTPTSTNNNDTCDIGVTPAATLLLPYFEVDVASAQNLAQNTIFTITNTSRFPQIAHVVVWTDWSYPVLDFNIFLTGYDVQGISMYDVIVRGIVAPPSPGFPIAGTTSVNPATGPSPIGSRSVDPVTGNFNPNFQAGAISTCTNLPGNLPVSLVTDVRNALTTGAYTANGSLTCVGTPGTASGRIGGTHANAIGYVTVDVANTCSINLPVTPAYFATEILYDNVLIGDYQQINPNPTTGNYAGGNPMVHIRAVPEGGLSGSVPGTNLPFTFYDRYTVGAPGGRTSDRRQPLPSTFAARFIQGGTGQFNTNYKIWREGVTNSQTACAVYNWNSALPVTDIVRFDEHENPTLISGGGLICSPNCGPSGINLPETSSTSTSAGAVFPPSSSTPDVAGWMYLNLSNGGVTSATSPSPAGNLPYSASRAGYGPAAPTTPGSRTVSQNWVIISMFAEGRFSVDFDAAWLGNGCTPGLANGAVIAPATQRTGPLVCPPPLTPTGAPGQCGVGTLPPFLNP